MKQKADWVVLCAQTPTERELLRVVDFWWPKARARRDGHNWLVKSIAELLDDHELPSERSIRRAVKALKDADILIVERHRHPYKPSPGPVYWIRPNFDQIGRYVAGSWPEGGRKVAGTYIQTTDPIETDNKDGAMRGKAKTGADFLAKKKASATIAEGLSHFTSKTAMDFQHVATPQVAHHCMTAANAAAGLPTPGSFNPQRGGQLKTFLRRARNETHYPIDPPRVGAFLFFMANHWSEFLGWMDDTFGATVAGTAPSHNALAKYAVEMTQFYGTYEAQSEPSVKDSVSGNGNLDGDFG